MSTDISQHSFLLPESTSTCLKSYILIAQISTQINWTIFSQTSNWNHILSNKTQRKIEWNLIRSYVSLFLNTVFWFFTVYWNPVYASLELVSDNIYKFVNCLRRDSCSNQRLLFRLVWSFESLSLVWLKILCWYKSESTTESVSILSCYRTEISVLRDSRE